MLLWLLGGALGLNVSRQKALSRDAAKTQAAGRALSCIELLAFVGASCPFVANLGVRLEEVTVVDLLMHALHRGERLQILVAKLEVPQQRPGSLLPF